MVIEHYINRHVVIVITYYFLVLEKNTYIRVKSTVFILQEINIQLNYVLCKTIYIKKKKINN